MARGYYLYEGTGRGNERGCEVRDYGMREGEPRKEKTDTER